MVSRVIPVDPFDLVIFGGTGDLARRKILPALFRRFCDGQMPPEARIIGAARTQQSAADWAALGGRGAGGIRARQAAPGGACGGVPRAARLPRGGCQGRWRLVRSVRQDAPGRGAGLLFLGGAGLFGDLAERLHQFKIARQDARIVVEKPFGNDLASARALNRTLSGYFDETQIYRIDHYLGKETVQNLMAVRFGNVLFEPLWNTQYVDHVQITVAEEVGVGGRGAYYDQSGAMRDMVQNHLMQLLCLTAMEPPSKFDPDAVRDEKLKVIRALDPVAPEDIVRGQYKADGTRPSYRRRRKPDSRTESFIALKLHVSNWRWNGTPFYLRTGKRLKARKSEIVIHFKEPPHSIFDEDAGSRHNVLSIRLQPDEGIDLRVTIKEPGPGGMRLMDVPLDMSFADALGADGVDVPDAYERLIMDVIRGNQTLFMRGDEVEAAWAWTDPIIEGWTRRGDRPAQYEPGSSGPEEALMLLHRDGRRWREIGG
jgi:glucose-6-phosphate 1-dehydrogenase